MFSLGCNCCGYCDDTKTSSRWSVLQAEVETEVDKVWLDLYCKEYAATPVQSSTDAITHLCRHFNLATAPVLDALQARRELRKALPAPDAIADQQLQYICRPDAEEHYLSIYSYTMDALYKTANQTVNAQNLRCVIENGVPALSGNVKAVLPWFKMVDTALLSLPDTFKYHGTLFRVMGYTFEQPVFDQRFQVGKTFVWHTHRSASRSQDILTNPDFTPGTVFEIKNAVGIEITKMSQFPGECEILLRPGTTLRVLEARKGRPDPGGDVRKTADWITVEMLPEQQWS